MSAQTQQQPPFPVLFDAPDLHQVPGSTPSASPSASSQHTPHFRIEPPTPTTALNEIANRAFAEKSNDDAVMALFNQAQALEQGHQQPTHFDPAQMNPQYLSGDALRASPAPYGGSRHHPYSGSASSYDDGQDSLEGGPARNKRNSISHQSHSSYESGDADFVPDAADMYMEPMRQASGGRASKSPRAKEPIRLTATGKPSHARRLPPGHIKRPRNAFILFRSHACVNNLIPTELGITDHRHVSRIVGNLWKSLPAEEKRIWEEQAEKEKEEHRRAHPDYKYRPVYRREGVVRRRRRKAVDEKEVEEEERKCEVVARVLLEGGDVNEDRVEKEIEVQRERDEVEGRVRGPQSRSPSRGARQHHQNQQQHVMVQQGYDPAAYGQYQQGYMQYPDPVFHDPYAARRQNPPRQSAQNIRYDFDHQQQDEEGRGGEEGYGMPQRSQTLPPYYEDPAFYAHHQQQQQQQQHGARAAPPQPLSLYHPSGEHQPISPGALFRPGNDSTIGGAVPATPRTIAMQQHMMSLQQRIGNRNGQSMRDDTMLGMVSPSSQFHPDGLGFDQSFLDGALAAGDHADRAGSVDLAHQQRSFSADDAGAGRRPAWQPQYHVEGNDVFLIPGQPGAGGSSGPGIAASAPAASSMEGASKTGQPQSYSALGEIAAGSKGEAGTPIYPPTSEAGISFQPDADVAYVFLDAKQAQDQQLVDSIRAQGFGITLDASEQDLAQLGASGILAH